MFFNFKQSHDRLKPLGISNYKFKLPTLVLESGLQAFGIGFRNLKIFQQVKSHKDFAIIPDKFIC